MTHTVKQGVCWITGLLTACSQSLSPSPSPAPSLSPSTLPAPSTAVVASPPAKSPTVKAFEQRLQADIIRRSKIAVQRVNCPAQVPIEVTQPFSCQAMAEGKTFVVVVAPRASKRELQWSTKGLLVLPKLEQTIQQGIQTQFRLDVKTNCGGKVRVARSGDRFQCKITDDRGQTRAVTVQVDDDKGNVTWKL